MVPKDPNSSPVVGRLGADDKLSLVIPVGRQSESSCNIPTFSYLGPYLQMLPEYIRNPILINVHRFSLWLEDNNWWLWGSETRTLDVYTLDAESGKLLWVWEGPTLNRPCNAGDENGFIPRIIKG